MSNQYKYELIIYWSEKDNLFIVEIPELPGCVADGGNYAEAVLHQSLISMPAGEPSVLATRPAMEDALRKLLTMISLLNSGEPIAELTAVIRDLNNLITTSLSSVKAADTREENAKKEESEKQEPTK